MDWRNAGWKGSLEVVLSHPTFKAGPSPALDQVSSGHPASVHKTRCKSTYSSSIRSAAHPVSLWMFPFALLSWHEIHQHMVCPLANPNRTSPPEKQNFLPQAGRSMDAPKDFFSTGTWFRFSQEWKGGAYFLHYYSHLKHSLTCNYIILRKGPAQYNLIAHTPMQMAFKKQDQRIVQSRVEQIWIILCTLYENLYKYFTSLHLQHYTWCSNAFNFLLSQRVSTLSNLMGLFTGRTVHIQNWSLLQQQSLENSMWNQSEPVSRRRIGSALNVHVGYCLKSCPSCYRLEALAVRDDTLRLPY